MKKQQRKGLYMGLLAFAGYMLLTTFLFGEVCPMYIMVGLPCPACGLTRAGLLLLQGRWEESFQMHALLVVWIAYFLWFLYNQFVGTHKSKKRKRMEIWMVVAIVFVTLLYYGYRMAVYFPDTEPMVWSEHKVLFDLQHILRNGG